MNEVGEGGTTHSVRAGPGCHNTFYILDYVYFWRLLLIEKSQNTPCNMPSINKTEKRAHWELSLFPGGLVRP